MYKTNIYVNTIYSYTIGCGDNFDQWLIKALSYSVQAVPCDNQGS